MGEGRRAISTRSKLQPGNAEVAYRLGEALLQQGKMKEAADVLRRSNTLRPDMPETLYSLGRALTIGDPIKAERAFESVITLERTRLFPPKLILP
jgi:cytochrome c-type biogenesis protein CcmH/NrfG